MKTGCLALIVFSFFLSLGASAITISSTQQGAIEDAIMILEGTHPLPLTYTYLESNTTTEGNEQTTTIVGQISSSFFYSYNGSYRCMIDNCDWVADYSNPLNVRYKIDLWLNYVYPGPGRRIESTLMVINTLIDLSGNSTLSQITITKANLIMTLMTTERGDITITFGFLLTYDFTAVFTEIIADTQSQTESPNGNSIDGYSMIGILGIFAISAILVMKKMIPRCSK